MRFFRTAQFAAAPRGGLLSHSCRRRRTADHTPKHSKSPAAAEDNITRNPTEANNKQIPPKYPLAIANPRLRLGGMTRDVAVRRTARATASPQRRPAIRIRSITRPPQAATRKHFHHYICGSLSRAVRRRPTAADCNSPPARACPPPSANSRQKKTNPIHVIPHFSFPKKKNEWNLFRQPPVCDVNPRPTVRWHDVCFHIFVLQQLFSRLGIA